MANRTAPPRSGNVGSNGMDTMDEREHVRALISLYATGLEFTNIASCRSHELRALLTSHVEEIERVMENIRTLMQPVEMAMPMTPTTV